MTMMKKRMVSAVSLLLCVVMVVTCISGTVVQAKASSATVYSTSGDCISMFLKKNGKLTIKTTWAFDKWKDGSENCVDTKLKKISYPLAKNCKWTHYYVGETKPDSYTSYKSLKKVVEEEYYYAQKEGYYDSPTGIWVFVKNKKIVEVRSINS